MNTKHLLILFTWITGTYAENVHFTIKKTGENSENYEIFIIPTTNLNPSSLPNNFIIAKNTIKIDATSGNNLNENDKSSFKNLDQAIKTKMTDSIFYFNPKTDPAPTNTINVTINDLSVPTEFNQAYRDLYNDVRTFSQAISQPNTLSRIKSYLQSLIFKTPHELINPKPILPDLAAEPTLLQQHGGKVATAGAVAASGLAAWLYLKSKQTGQ